MNIHSSIQDAIKKCNLVFFVGAGFSRPLGLPNWTELVKIITDDLKGDYPNDAFISNIVDMIRQKYYTEIEALDKLKPKHLPRILDILERTTGVDLSDKDLSRHEKIWHITDQVITTNYDQAFERRASTKSPKVVYEDDFHVARLSGMDGFLFKVHGSIEHPAKCVLFSDQYKKLYNEQTGATLELFRILSDKTIIFLGFSLNDPFVNELLDLRQKAYQGLKQNHFIITTDDKDFSEYGVERIMTVNNYGEDLNEFLDELVKTREDYPYGLGMLIRGLIKEGVEFNIEVVRKNYFDLIDSLERKPETAAVAEDVRAGEFGNAEDQLRSELDAELKIIEEHRGKAAAKAYELAELKKLQLKYSEALQYYQQTIDLVPKKSLYINQMGFMMLTLGQYKKALDYYEQALAIDLETYGERHPEIALNYNNIGETLRNLGEFDKALEYYDKALSIDLEFRGPRDAEIAIRYNNMGAAWQELKQYKKALEFYEKSLSIDLEVYGERHSSTATDYNNMGLTLNDLGEHDKALEYYEKALSIDLELHGERHPDTAIDYNNIGTIWDFLGDDKKALEFYEKALSIDLEINGEGHPTLAYRYNNIGSALQDLGDTPKAVEYYKKALLIALDRLGKDHPLTHTITGNLESAGEKID